MGRDRQKIYKESLDDDLEIIELCRRHHIEAEDMGKISFCKKYKVFGIKKRHVKERKDE